MGAVTLLTMARRVNSHAAPSTSEWQNRTVFGSGGPVCAVTAMYIWDTTLNSVLLTLLQPTLYKSYLRSWLMSDIHQHLALDMVGNVGEQKWYAFDDMMVTLPSSLDPHPDPDPDPASFPRHRGELS